MIELTRVSGFDSAVSVWQRRRYWDHQTVCISSSVIDIRALYNLGDQGKRHSVVLYNVTMLMHVCILT
jgi:hypothetical protein